MSKPTILTKCEFIGGLTVYWVGTADDQKQYGVCFEGEVENIHRQGVAESLTFANDLLTDMVENEL